MTRHTIPFSWVLSSQKAMRRRCSAWHGLCLLLRDVLESPTIPRGGGRYAVLVSLSRAWCHWPGEPADMPALAHDAMVELPAPAPGRGLRGGGLAIAILLTAQA